MKSVVFAIVACAALAACTPAGEPSADPVTPAASEPAAPVEQEPAQPPSEDACNAAQYANLVGRPADLPGVPLASPLVRHIRPDTQVTMDYRPERLNIDIDADGMITGFRCG